MTLEMMLKEARREGMTWAIIDALKEMGEDEDAIVSKLTEKLRISKEEAGDMLKLFDPDFFKEK
jgi:hypothetical protein